MQTQFPTNPGLLQLREYGLKSWVSRKAGIPCSEVHKIFRGVRNPTPKQAIVLEGLFAKKKIPLDKVDLVFGRDPAEETVTLEELLIRKLERLAAEAEKDL